MSYSRIGKAAAEIIGQSTNNETVKLWPSSLNASRKVAESLEAMEDKSSTNNMHNGEKNSRISHDQVDPDILRKKLEVCIDIFDDS